jgi:hypothetical protein
MSLYFHGLRVGYASASPVATFRGPARAEEIIKAAGDFQLGGKFSLKDCFLLVFRRTNGTAPLPPEIFLNGIIAISYDPLGEV